MVQIRKPVIRSEDIIDLRGLTPAQARAVVAAHDKARLLAERAVGLALKQQRLRGTGRR